MTSSPEERKIPSPLSHRVPSNPSPATMATIREELEAEIVEDKLKHPHQLDTESKESWEQIDALITPNEDSGTLGEDGLTITSPGTYEQLEKLTDPKPNPELGVTNTTSELMEDLMDTLSKEASITPGSLASFSKENMRASATPSPLSTGRSMQGRLSPLGMNPPSPAPSSEKLGYFDGDSPLPAKSHANGANRSQPDEEAIQPEVLIADAEEHARLIGFAKEPFSVERYPLSDSILTEPGSPGYQTPSRPPMMPQNTPASVISYGSGSSPANVPLPPSAGSEKHIQFAPSLINGSRTPLSIRSSSWNSELAPKTPVKAERENAVPRLTGRRRLTSLPTEIETLVSKAKNDENEKENCGEASQDIEEKIQNSMDKSMEKGEIKSFAMEDVSKLIDMSLEELGSWIVETGRLDCKDEIVEKWYEAKGRKLSADLPEDVLQAFDDEVNSILKGGEGHGDEITQIYLQTVKELLEMEPKDKAYELYTLMRQPPVMLWPPREDQVAGILNRAWPRISDTASGGSELAIPTFVKVIHRIPAAMVWVSVLGIWRAMNVVGSKVTSFFRDGRN